jgi:hypothetical protein
MQGAGMEGLTGFVPCFFSRDGSIVGEGMVEKKKDIWKEGKNRVCVHDLLATNFCTKIAPPCIGAALLAPKLLCPIPELLRWASKSQLWWVGNIGAWVCNSDSSVGNLCATIGNFDASLG